MTLILPAIFREVHVADSGRKRLLLADSPGCRAGDLYLLWPQGPMGHCISAVRTCTCPWSSCNQAWELWDGHPCHSTSLTKPESGSSISILTKSMCPACPRYLWKKAALDQCFLLQIFHLSVSSTEEHYHYKSVLPGREITFLSIIINTHKQWFVMKKQSFSNKVWNV